MSAIMPALASTNYGVISSPPPKWFALLRRNVGWIANVFYVEARQAGEFASRARSPMPLEHDVNEAAPRLTSFDVGEGIVARHDRLRAHCKLPWTNEIRGRFRPSLFANIAWPQ